MRTMLLLLVLLAGPVLASQTVWKWVDESGVTHYSDRPVPGATRMEVSGGNRSGASSSGSDYSSSSSASARPPANAGPPYADFEIWKPADGEAFVNVSGEVTVNVRLNPPLQYGHDLYLYLDGRPLEDFPANTLSFDLTEVPRGEHTVVATISSKGAKIQETPPVHFTVRQESVAQPPVGPAMQSQPKPQPRGASNKMPGSQPTYASLNGGRKTDIDPATNRPAGAKLLPAGPKAGN
jgi:hypothetical protein